MLGLLGHTVSRAFLLGHTVCMFGRCESNSLPTFICIIVIRHNISLYQIILHDV